MRYENGWNRVANTLLEAHRIPILRAWLSTSMASDAHVGLGDCTHWCLPGVPDLWAIQLADLLHSILR